MTASVTAAQLENLTERRILFGHQSVGADITEGLKRIAASRGVRLNIVADLPGPNADPGFYHFKVGQNGDPAGKLADFLAKAGSPSNAGVDVAIVKLCYIDFTESTDPKALALEYIGTLNRVRQAQPGTRVIAMTVPLTTIQTGPKAWVKRLLGKQPAGYRMNAQRQIFNDDLRKHFDEHSLFDIAQIEATAAGSQTFSYDGRSVQALSPALTYDGRHLNEKGAEIAASALVSLIASN